METLNLSAEQKNLIEKLGVYHEQTGMQPACARVLSLLLVSNETELAFDQIRETLAISKSAASNAINLLMSIGKIEYITHLGDRKRYFRIRMRNWKSDLRKSLHLMMSINDLLKEVHVQRPDTTAAFNENLKELIDFLDFLHGEIDNIYERWESKKDS